MSTAAPSRSGRRLALVFFVPGILAASLVIITLVLIAVDGHPEGLLTVIAGVAVPIVLWGAWRLGRLAHTRLRLAADAPPSLQAELKIELRSTSVRWPPTGKTITFP